MQYSILSTWEHLALSKIQFLKLLSVFRNFIFFCRLNSKCLLYLIKCTLYLIKMLQKQVLDRIKLCSELWQFRFNIFELLTHQIRYRTRVIMTRGLYTFYPLFEVQKRFFSRGFFVEFLALCMVSIQERFLIKSGL